MPSSPVTLAVERFGASAGMARAYDAASQGRRTEGWYAGATSANAEVGMAAARVSWRARDLVRNNPYAAAGVRKLASKIYGTEIRPRPKNLPKAARQQFAEDWDRFVDTSDPSGHLNFGGQALQGTRAVISDGETLFQTRFRTAKERKRKHPLEVRVLETDWLDRSKTQALDGGGKIVQGVEFDASGGRDGYWLFDEHPGEPMLSLTGGGYGLASKRANADTILHVFDPLRPGQARGVSWFAPVVIKMRDVGDTDDARVVLEKIAACLSGFVSIEAGSTPSPLTQGTSGKLAEDAKKRPIERFSPGMVHYLRQGEKIEFAEPPTSAGYADFMGFQLHAIAAGLGTTYEQLTGDLKGVNFSSIRHGELDFRDLLDCWQWLMLAKQLIQPLAEQVQLCRQLGWRPDPLWTGFTFGMPRRAWVDPKKDLEATVGEVRSGIRSLRDVVSERGEDLDDVLDEIAEDNKAIDERGLILESDPRRTARSGTAASAAAKDEPGNDTDEPKETADAE